jgi:type IX secretion system substrate protein
MKYLLTILLIVGGWSLIMGQVYFNKRLHFGFPAAVLTSILPTDSCYYATGIFADSLPPYKAGNIFLKFDLTGDIVFAKTVYSSYKTYETWEGDLIATPDGNLADIGYTIDTIQKLLFLKYTPDGDTLFTKEFFSPYYPGSSFFVTRELILSPSGGFYILGGIEYYINDTNTDFVLMELDSNANLLWQKTYGSSTLHDFPEAMTLDNDGGLLIGVGKNNKNVTNKNFIARTYIIKTDSAGNMEWEYLTPVNVLRDAARDIVRTNDGGLVIASGKGIEEPVHPSIHLLSWESGYIYKLNANKQLVWDLEIKDSINPSYINYFSKLIPIDNEEAFVAAGQFSQIFTPTSGDLFGWLVKVSADGELLWLRKHHIVESNEDWHIVYDLRQTSDGGFIMVGEASDYDTIFETQQAWIIKLDSFGCLVPGCQLIDDTKEAKEGGTLLLYPNPAKDYLNFFYRSPGISQKTAFRIFDVQGRLMKQFDGNEPEMTYIVPVWDWAAGVYFLQVEAGGVLVKTEKFIVQP